jgi:hypothetical protein
MDLENMLAESGDLLSDHEIEQLLEENPELGERALEDFKALIIRGNRQAVRENCRRRWAAFGGAASSRSYMSHPYLTRRKWRPLA